MLTSLTVKNLAIIENLQIDFENGMTVLTGETGAGKSLIIDAISLLFGYRASNNLIRDGENKTLIEGTFINYNNKVKQLLADLEIDEEDEILILRREIYQTGKSVGKINGYTVPVSTLSLIGDELGNIHTQFDTQKLINPKNYFNYVDDDEINELLKIYKDKYSIYKKKDKAYKDLLNQDNIANQKLDYLKYQLNELEKAKLSINEEEELFKQSKVIGNYEKIMSNYQEFKNIYENNNVLDNIYDSINYLEKIASFDENMNSKKEILNELYYSLNDVVYEVINESSKIDFDENEIDRINSRLSVYSDLKRKYKMSTSELIEYFENIKQEVNLLENHDFYLQEAKKELDKILNETKNIADEISIKRYNNSIKLENNIINSLKELQLKNVEFKITLDKDNLKENGQDLIDFLVSFNKGESVKSLNKTASGGELSRFMLALKEISSFNMKDETLIFDEIDTGVNGEVAYAIASKIKKISEYAQVLCVTHLPQVASICDHHFNITKDSYNDNKTVTTIKLLNNDERVNVIASMLSKDEITPASILLAKELLKK